MFVSSDDRETALRGTAANERGLRIYALVGIEGVGGKTTLGPLHLQGMSARAEIPRAGVGEFENKADPHVIATIHAPRRISYDNLMRAAGKA